MARQQQSPYTGRYKKSMSPQLLNPFQGRRSLSSRNLLPRYAPFPHKDCQMSKALKQACIILVAGTILVSLLSVAIPPAPTSVHSHMAAPRPQLSSSGGLRNSVRQRGGVQSQSMVRTNVKPKDNPISDKQHHWGADTLENSGTDSMEEESSEESPSKQQAAQQLAAQIEHKTKKQNAAADGVFGRTNDEVGGGDDNVNKKNRVVAAKTLSKGQVVVDASESSEGDQEVETEESESKQDVKANIIQVEDEEVVSEESDTGDETASANTEDAEKELAMNSGELSEMNLKDESEEDTSPSDEIEEKQGVFGKDGIQNNEKEDEKAAIDDNKAADDGAAAKDIIIVREKDAEAEKVDTLVQVDEEEMSRDKSNQKANDSKDDQMDGKAVGKTDESVGRNEAKDDNSKAGASEANAEGEAKADESQKGSAIAVLESAHSERKRVARESPVNDT